MRLAALCCVVARMCMSWSLLGPFLIAPMADLGPGSSRLLGVASAHLFVRRPRRCQTHRIAVLHARLHRSRDIEESSQRKGYGNMVANSSCRAPMALLAPTCSAVCHGARQVATTKGERSPPMLLAGASALRAEALVDGLHTAGRFVRLLRRRAHRRRDAGVAEAATAAHACRREGGRWEARGMQRAASNGSLQGEGSASAGVS